MAAYRSGMKTVILPKDNQKDLEEIDPVVRQGLRFVGAETIDTVLAEALVYPEQAEQSAREGMNVTFTQAEKSAETVLRQ